MTDSNGLYYMRARYYNPEIKRFINQDVLLGSISSGQSLNRYAYVNGNPVSYIDPFGLSRDGDSLLRNVGSYALGAGYEFYNSFSGGLLDYALGINSQQSDNMWFQEGRKTGAIVAIAWGIDEAGIGSVAAFGGGAITVGTGGGGAIVGVPACAAGGLMMGHGSIMAGTGVQSYRDASNYLFAKGRIKNTYNSIKEAPVYPEGFEAVQNGTKKVNINNKDILEALREVEPGRWKKVYKNGFDANGNRISIHYFESPSGKVFDVKVKQGWSNI